VGLFVGIVISILVIVIVIGIVIGFFLLRRRGRHSNEVESQSSSDENRSVLKMDFIDDHIGDGDDTILTTYTDHITDEGDSQIAASIPTDFVVNLGSPLIV
jgi:MFS superfamily sulfate permease-like transporter